MSGNASFLRLSGADLGCIRGGQHVFSGVSFAVSAGQALALTGPNGAGKTTLLRVIAGLLRLSEGTLEFPAARRNQRSPNRSIMSAIRMR